MGLIEFKILRWGKVAKGIMRPVVIVILTPPIAHIPDL